MPRKSRERQLAKLAARRQAERRRQQRKRAIALGVAAAVVVAVGLSAVAAITGREPEPRATGTGSPTPTPSAPAVACNGKEPEAAGERKPTFDAPPEMTIDPGETYVATVKTSCGRIELRLFAEEAPITVNNFIFLAEQGFYDGLTFHRIVPDFVIQGGDPKGSGRGGPGYQFEDEIVSRLKFDGSGLLAMANSGPDTNGSQFFITLGEAEHLNGKHTIFGEVIGGTDVVREIGRLPTGPDERPLSTVYILRVTITVEG